MHGPPNETILFCWNLCDFVHRYFILKIPNRIKSTFSRHKAWNMKGCLDDNNYNKIQVSSRNAASTSVNFGVVNDVATFLSFYLFLRVYCTKRSKLCTDQCHHNKLELITFTIHHIYNNSFSEPILQVKQARTAGGWQPAFRSKWQTKMPIKSVGEGWMDYLGSTRPCDPKQSRQWHLQWKVACVFVMRLIFSSDTAWSHTWLTSLWFCHQIVS